jgi:hypothetical protein
MDEAKIKDSIRSEEKKSKRLYDALQVFRELDREFPFTDNLSRELRKRISLKIGKCEISIRDWKKILE